ncbi:MAG: hypothetical protein NTZ80_01790 [Patescibacteria group bacterium]|nr:hypothetical protein [Patescibacteria group bacterium]
MTNSEQTSVAAKNNQSYDREDNPNSERMRCKVYSRVVGYIRPVSNWNDSKANEFAHRVTFSEKIAGNKAKDLPL